MNPYQDALDEAGRNIAPGPPATAMESMTSASELSRSQNTMLGPPASLHLEYERYRQEIEAETGEKLFNPYSYGAKERPAEERRFLREVQRLREIHPDLAVRTSQDIRDAIAQQRAETRERRRKVEARESGLASVAGFAGAAGPILGEPLILGSMAFGARAAHGIIRGALIEGGIATGVEIPLQANIQFGRTQFGEDPSLTEAAANVAAAGVGGAALSGLVRGVARGVAALRRTAVDDAEAYLARQAEMEATRPFDDTPAGRAEHVERLDEAMVSLHEGRAAVMADTRTPVRETGSPTNPAIAREEMTAIEIAGSDAGAALRREIQEQAAKTPLASPEARVLEGAETSRPTRPRADIPTTPTDEELFTRALEADVRRDFAGMEDSLVRIEDDAGNVREMSIREMLDDMTDDESFLRELQQCVLV